MVRHRFQKGFVFKRGTSSKVWVGRWREWTLDQNGSLKRVLRSEVLATVAEVPAKGEARRLLERRLLLLNQGVQQADSTITFANFVEVHWKPAMLPAYKLSTQKQFELAAKNYLLPAFGKRRLRDITKAEVQTFFGNLVQRLAPATVHGLHRFLRRILAVAAEWNYIQVNPARGIKLPAPGRREPPFLKPEQFQNLLSILEEPTRTMVLLAMMTSMRIGEILALRWGRVDLDRRVIRVAETCYRGCLSSVKTRRSERQIPMSSSVLQALQERARTSNDDPQGLVFATRKGTPLGDGNLLTRYLYPACDRLGIPRLSWHSLRHLHSTLLSQLGVPVAVAQAQLGHADPRMTLAVYTHVLPGAQKQAVDQLETYLFPTVPKLHNSGATGNRGYLA